MTAAEGLGRGRGVLDRVTLRRVVVVLCLTEITSWGVLYYAFPVLAPTIGRETGWATTSITGAFSLSLLASAAAGPVVGHWIDRYGPRVVMASGSLVAVPALAAVAVAQTYPAFLVAWVVTGIASSALLYPPAFAAITHWAGPRRVPALTAVTLVAGLASTVFAPLTAFLDDRLGWRSAYVALAVVLAATVPAHWLGLRVPWVRRDRAAGPPADPADAPAARSASFWVLLAAMCLAATCVYAGIINLVPLWLERGLSPYEAAAALGVGGVGQACGRLGYGWVAARTSPHGRGVLVSGAVALMTGVMALLPGPYTAILVVSLMLGAARGQFTLIQATAVSDRWGVVGFGRLNGIMMAPVMLATAAAPWLGSVLAEWWGSYQAAFLGLTGCAVAALVLMPWTAPGRDPRRARG